MFRPDGAHLFVRRKFTAICLRKGFVKRRFFLGAQLKYGLILAGQSQKHAGKVILHFWGETAHRLNSLFKQFWSSLDNSPFPVRTESYGDDISPL
jgi:hypothetical protein